MDFSSGMLLLVLLLQVLGHVQPFFLPHLRQGHYRVPSLEENAHSDPGTVHYSIPVPHRSTYREYSVNSDIHTPREVLSIDTSKVFHESVNFNKHERKIGISDLAFQHRFLDILYSIHNFSCNSGALTKPCVRLPIPPNVRNYFLNNTASVEEFKKYLERIGYVVDAMVARDLHHCFSNALNTPSRYQAHLVSSLLKRNSILIVDKDTLTWKPGAVYLPSEIHKKVTQTLLQSTDMNNCFNYLRHKRPDSNEESKYEVENIKTSINETIFNTSGSHKATTQSVTERHFDTTTKYQDELNLRSTNATKLPTIETTEQTTGKESTPASIIETTAQYSETPVETTENTKKNVDETNMENTLFPFEDEQQKLPIQPIINEFDPPQSSSSAFERNKVEDVLSVTTVDTTKELNVDSHETAIGKDNEITSKYPDRPLDISTELYETLTEYKIITESTTVFPDLSIEKNTENSHASAEYSTSFGKTDREDTNVYEATTDIMEYEDPRKTITTNDNLTVETTSKLPEMMVYQDILHVSRTENPTFPIDTTTALHESIQLQDIPYEPETNHHTFSTEITDELTIKEFPTTRHVANLEYNTFSVETTSVLPEIIKEFHATSTVPEADHLSFSKETTIMPTLVKEFHSIAREPGVEDHTSSIETTDLPYTTKEFHNIIRKTSTEDSTETTTVLFETLKKYQYVRIEGNEKFSPETTTDLTDVTNMFNGISQEPASEHHKFTLEITTDLPEVTSHNTDPENHTFSDESTIVAYDIEKYQNTPGIPITEYQTHSIDTTTIIPEVVKSLHNIADAPSSEHHTVTTETTTDLLEIKGFVNIARDPNLNNPTSLTEKTTKKFHSTPQVLEYQTSSFEATTLVPEIVNSLHSIADEPSLDYNLASAEITTDLPKIREFHNAPNEPNRDNIISSVEETTAIRSDVLKEFHTTSNVATIEYQTIADETTTTQPQMIKSLYHMADGTNSEQATFPVKTTTDLLEIVALRNIPREPNRNNPAFSIKNTKISPEIIQENHTPTEYETASIDVTTTVPEMNRENVAGESTMEQTMRSFDATPLLKIFKGFHNTPNGLSANHHIYSFETSTPLPSPIGYNDIPYETNLEHTTFSADRVTVLPEIITEFSNTVPISTVDDKTFTLETTLLPKSNDVRNIVYEQQTFSTEAATILSELKDVHNTAQDNSEEHHATIEYTGGQDGISKFHTMPAKVITENHITAQEMRGTLTASIETFTESTQDYEEKLFEALRELNKTLGEFVNDKSPITAILENLGGEIKIAEHFQKDIDEVVSIETTTTDNVPDSSIVYSPIIEEFTATEFNSNTAETTIMYGKDQLDENLKMSNSYQKMLQILHPSQDISKNREFINVLDILASETATAKDSPTKSFSGNRFEIISENNDKLVPVINVPGDNIVFLDNLIPVYLNQMRDDFQTRMKDNNIFTTTKSNELDSSYDVESNSDAYNNNLFSRLFNIYRNMTRNDSMTTQSTEDTPEFHSFIHGSENYNMNVPNLNITDDKGSILSSSQKISLSDTPGVDQIFNGINGNTTPTETNSISYRSSNSSEIKKLYLEDDSGFTDASLLSKNQENSLDIKGKAENGIVTEMLEESLITELNMDIATTESFSNNKIGSIDTKEDRNYEKDATLNHDTVEDTTIITERTMSSESTLEQENNNSLKNPIAYFEVIEDKTETNFVATGMTDKPKTTTVENERKLQSTDFPKEELDGISTTDPFVDITSTEQEIQYQALENESHRDVPDLQFLTTVLPSFIREENKIINFELTPDEHVLMDKIYRHVMSRSYERDRTGNEEYSIVNNSTSSQDIVSLRSLVPIVVHYVNTENVSDEEIRILRDIFEELFENFKDQSEVEINFDAEPMHVSLNDRENLGENNDQIKKKLDLNKTMKSLHENNVTSLDNWAYFKFWKEALNTRRNSTNINGNGKENTIILKSSENEATLIDDNRNTEKAAEKELLRSKRMLDDTNFPQGPDDHSTSGRNLFDILSQYGMYQPNKDRYLEKFSNNIDSLLGPIEENTKFSNFNKSTINILKNRILSDVGRSERIKVNSNRIRRSSFPFNIVLTIPNKDSIDENSHKNWTESDTNDKYENKSLHYANEDENSSNSRSFINILKNGESSAVVGADITAQSVNSQRIGNTLQLKKSSTEKKSAFHKFLLGKQGTETSDVDKVKYGSKIPYLLPSNNIQLDPIRPTDITTKGIVDDGAPDLHTEGYLSYDIDIGQYIYPGDVIYDENGTGEKGVNEYYDHVRNKRI